jgi:hypothetical protein
LVVAGGVEGELADEVAVLGEDADVEVVGEDQDPVAGVASAEADVVEAAVVAQGDRAVVADAVVADPVVAVDEGGAGGDGLGRVVNASAGVCRRRARWGRMVL